MGKVDLNLLRLAVYEIRYDEEIPVKVAINEAVFVKPLILQSLNYPFLYYLTSSGSTPTILILTSCTVSSRTCSKRFGLY